MLKHHAKIEKNSVLLLIFTVIVISIGGIVEILPLFRMETTDPAAMMPELGRALVHEEGVLLIRQWIESLQGSCE